MSTPQPKANNVTPHPAMARLRALTSAVMSRIGLGLLTGTAYGGARDYYTIFGYSRNLSHQDFLGKYLRQDITQRVVNAPVDATWTDPPEVSGGSAFDAAWKDLVENQDLFSKLAEVDRYAALGQFSVLLIGLDDGRNLAQPANPGRQSKVIYLQPYLEGSVQIKSYDENPTSPRFGLPVTYEITPGDINQLAQNLVTQRIVRNKFIVHYSRVLHIADNCLENGIYGHSRLEPIYNILDDLMKVVGGSAETYWMAGNRGLQVDVDKEMELNEDDGEAIEDEVEEYQHGLRRFMRTRGVKISNIGSDVADPKNTFDVLISMLSAATGIPKRVLIGVEAGQLASQQDRANWAVLISERIAKFAQPKVLKPAIKTFQLCGVLPEAKELEAKWPDAYKMSPLERAQTSAQMARSMTNAVKALATARNEVDIPVFSVEEVRQAVAFGKHMPVLDGVPTGTVPPKKEPEPKAVPFGGNPAR